MAGSITFRIYSGANKDFSAGPFWDAEFTLRLAGEKNEESIGGLLG